MTSILVCRQLEIKKCAKYTFLCNIHVPAYIPGVVCIKTMYQSDNYERCCNKHIMTHCTMGRGFHQSLAKQRDTDNDLAACQGSERVSANAPSSDRAENIYSPIQNDLPDNICYFFNENFCICGFNFHWFVFPTLQLFMSRHWLISSVRTRTICNESTEVECRK